MRSNQPIFRSHVDRNESHSLPIPDLVANWAFCDKVKPGSVRRPSQFPEPESYHEAIDPEAIFELEEEQRDGSISVIFVVPFTCKRCRLGRVACSRALPACVRCVRAGSECQPSREGYQELPGPKFVRGPRETSGTRGNAEASTSRRRVASGSKRPPSPESNPDPRPKKIRVKNSSRKGMTVRSTIELTRDMDEDSPETSGAGPLVAPTVVSAPRHSALKWTFLNNSHVQEEIPQSIPSNTQTPRVWTKSLEGLLTVFPELEKSTTGLSWFQFETPILLLNTNYARGHWIDSTTLSIDWLWDFSCRVDELESDLAAGGEDSAQPHTMTHFLKDTLDHEAQTVDSQSLPISSRPETSQSDVAISTFASTSDVGIPPPDSTPQYEANICEPPTSQLFPIQDAGGDMMMSDDDSLMLQYPTDPLLPPEDAPLSPPCSMDVESFTHRMTPQESWPTRIPQGKPPEVETLINSQVQLIPVLVWISCDSKLIPCNLPPEYRYVCMGLFFVSGLHHAVIQHDASSPDGVVQGRISWTITLQWAPGGEDALFDRSVLPSSDLISDSAPLCTLEKLLHPWWCHSESVLPRADQAAPLPPRDFRMQVFSCVPLDLLAEFQPSESFPRGWFCQACGMINIQVLFRHRICQSTVCRVTRKIGNPQGTVASLSRLRDPYQSSALIRPTNDIPSVVNVDRAIWDDGMQAWGYTVKDSVTLCHIFTGNQVHLQEDATALLEAVQREALLRKEDRLSPYFIHRTELKHPDDDMSKATVPAGTPDCVRVAYYTLCDFVFRYAEMDKPRFGEVRLQAWHNSGSKRGIVFHACKSPVVVHCLGVEVVLKLTPKGGYRNGTNPSTLEKGKGRAIDEDLPTPDPTESLAGPSVRLNQDHSDEASSSFVPTSEENQHPVVVGGADEATTDAGIVHQIATTDSSVEQLNPEKVKPQEVTKPKQGRVQKKKVKSKSSIPEISVALVHGDCLVLHGDDFECQIVRFGTTILVVGIPEAG